MNERQEQPPHELLDRDLEKLIEEYGGIRNVLAALSRVVTPEPKPMLSELDEEMSDVMRARHDQMDMGSYVEPSPGRKIKLQPRPRRTRSGVDRHLYP